MNFGGWRLLTDEPTLPRTKPRGWGLRVGGWGLGVGGWGLGVGGFLVGCSQKNGFMLTVCIYTTLCKDLYKT